MTNDVTAFEIPVVRQADDMLKLRDSAPAFDCTAVVECEVVHLQWHQLHCNHRLVLVFDSIDDSPDRQDALTLLCDSASRFKRLECELAIVSRDSQFEILTRLLSLSASLKQPSIGFPVIIDVDNQIASLYGILTPDGPMTACIIADSDAQIRSIKAHSYPVCLNIEELVDSVSAI